MQVLHHPESGPGATVGNGGHHRGLRRRAPRAPGGHRPGARAGRGPGGCRPRWSPSTATRPAWCGPSRRPSCCATCPSASSCWPTPASTTRWWSTSTRSGPRRRPTTSCARCWWAPGRPGRGGGRRLPLRPPPPGQRGPAAAHGGRARLRGGRARPGRGRRPARRRRPRGVVDRHPPGPGRRRPGHRHRDARPGPRGARPGGPAATGGPASWASRTANVAVPDEICLPADGIYAGWYLRPDGVGPTRPPCRSGVGPPSTTTPTPRCSKPTCWTSTTTSTASRPGCGSWPACGPRRSSTRSTTWWPRWAATATGGRARSLRPASQPGDGLASR